MCLIIFTCRLHYFIETNKLTIQILARIWLLFFRFTKKNASTLFSFFQLPKNLLVTFQIDKRKYSDIFDHEDSEPSVKKEKRYKESPETEAQTDKSNLTPEELEREKLREKVRQINLKFSRKKSTSPDAATSRDDAKSHSKSSTSTSHRKHSKDKRLKKGAKFEGKIRVPNLVKCRSFKGPEPGDLDGSNAGANNDSEKDKKQNDYVLSRLFKKTGVHSAMQVTYFLLFWAHFNSWHHLRRHANLVGTHSSRVGHICAKKYWLLVINRT